MTNIFFLLSILFFFISAFVLYRLWKHKELSLPKEEHVFTKKIGFISVITALILYILANIMAGIFFDLIEAKKSLHLSEEQYFSFVMPLASVLCILFFVGFIYARGLEVRNVILGTATSSKEKAALITKGILYGIGCFSLITVISIAFELLISFFGEFPRGEQISFAILQQLAATPWLFWITTFTFIFLIPVVEEFFFRGFLQNWLTGKWGAKAGIIITSIFFAFSHFSSSQKATNIPILVSIFVLSYIIGLAYERKRSLLVPIAVHVTNNAIYMVSSIIELFFMQ